MKRRHLWMAAVGLIMAICMCFSLSACGGCNNNETTHTHNWSETYTADGATGHYQTCDGCDEQKKEDHVYTNDEDTTCDKCGYTRTVTPPEPNVHGHEYNWTDNGDGTHNGVCTNTVGTCGTPTVTNEAHHFVNGVCDKCEAEEGGDTPVQHTHSYGNWTADPDDATKHIGTCTSTTGTCNAPTKTEAHVYDNDEDATCNECGATREITEPEPELITRAQYMAAAKGDKVKVSGVVTGIVGNNVYIQDNDGGYYLYNLSSLEGIAEGKTITATGEIDIYNGIREIKNVTVTVSEAAAVTVTPKDITSLFSSAESSSAADLVNLQGTLVTVKEATLSKQNNNYYFAVSSVSVQLYINGDQWNDLKTAFDEAVGSIADVTGFATVYSNKLQLTPYKSTADTLHVYTTLKAPVVTLEDNVAKWNAVEGATAYSYQLKTEGGNWVTQTPNLEATVTQFELTDGQSIRVMAIGGADAKNSGWSNAVEYTSVVYPTATMKYSGSTTSMAADGANNASLVGLSNVAFTVTSATNDTSNEVGLNGNGTIRLYSKKSGTGNGTSMTVTNNYQNIVSIKITLDSGSPAKFTSLKVVVGGNVVEGIVDGDTAEYTINAKSFTILNAYTSTSDNKQIHISEIEIEHLEYTAEQQAEIDAAEALAEAIAAAKTNVAEVKEALTLNKTYTGVTDEEGNEDVPVLPASGAHNSVITWAVKSSNAGDNFQFDEDDYTILIGQGDEAYTVVLTATITIYAEDGETVLAQDTKDISFTIPKSDNGEGGDTDPEPEEKEVLKLTASDFTTSYTSKDYTFVGTDGTTDYTVTTTDVGHFSNSGKIQLKNKSGTITITGTFTKIVIVYIDSNVPKLTLNGTALTPETNGKTLTFDISEAGTIAISYNGGATYMSSITFYAMV